MREDEQNLIAGRTSTYLIGYVDGERNRDYDGYYKHVDLIFIKSIHEIIQLVYDEFNKIRVSPYEITYNGLCKVGDLLVGFKRITKKEYQLFREYLNHSTKRYTVFYEFSNADHSIVKTSDSRMWKWRPLDKRPRNKWLKKHLELTK